MKTMDDLHGKVLRKFHTLCSKAGISPDDKATIVASYGVDSSADIDTHDLIDLCYKLSQQADPEQAKLDRLRKRLMAAIGAYLTAIDYASTSERIKAIACRASGYPSFNRIPADRLRSLYSAFCKYKRDLAAINDITAELIAER